MHLLYPSLSSLYLVVQSNGLPCWLYDCIELSNIVLPFWPAELLWISTDHELIANSSHQDRILFWRSHIHCDQDQQDCIQYRLDGT